MSSAFLLRGIRAAQAVQDNAPKQMKQWTVGGFPTLQVNTKACSCQLLARTGLSHLIFISTANSNDETFSLPPVPPAWNLSFFFNK